MRKARRQSRTSLERLRLAIDCLPVSTREAMLRGLRANERIIVGAYVDDRGGVCPMLAAHRAGGRTDFLAFAKSWDRFTGARGRSRPATTRELAILESQLEDSLAGAGKLSFDRAIAEHRKLRGTRLRALRRWREQAEPGGEIRARRLRRLASPERSSHSESPGRTNMISGTTHAGDVRSR